MPITLFMPNIDQLKRMGFKEGFRFDGIDDFMGTVKRRPFYGIRSKEFLIAYDLLGRYWYMAVDAFQPREIKIILNVDSAQTLYHLLGALKVEYNKVIF